MRIARTEHPSGSRGARPRRGSSILLVGLVLGVILAATWLPSALATRSALDDQLQAVKAATARYHSFEQAQKDGYTVAGEPCVASPLGVMGIHAINPALAADSTVDALRPELLLYAPRSNGKLELIGLEYFKADADQNLATDGDRPSLFGRPFDGPMPGHNPVMPVHFDMHVWLYADNPSGLFAPFNPAVSCG